MMDIQSSSAVSAAPIHAIPGPPGYPLVGALPKMRKDPLRFLLEAARRYGDVVLLGGIGSQRYFLINHPDDIERIFKTDHGSFVKGANFQLIKSIAGEGLFLSEGDFWRRQRRLIQPAFHLPRLAAMATTITGLTEETLARWEDFARRGEVVDMEREMMHLNLKIAVRILFGGQLTPAEAETVRESVTVAFEHLHNKVWALASLPGWVPTPANRRHQRAVSALDAVVYRLIERRRGSGEEGDDVLSMLLAVRDADTGEGMTDRQVRDEVVTLLVAGHESTALNLVWTLYLLSRHAHLEAKVHEEVDGVLGERPPTFEDLPRLSCTHRVIQESLRLYPPFWIFTRTPLEDEEIGGHFIPAGSVLMFSPYVTHRHPAFWHNPETVDPERFTPEKVERRPQFAYYPFGGGPRQCIGKRLSQFESQLILAAVARRYSLHLVPGQRVEPEPTLSLRPCAGLPVTLHRRA